MPKFEVYWSKQYYASGAVEVEADDARHAESIVAENIGDYTGHMEYCPENDFINAVEEINEDGKVSSV